MKMFPRAPLRKQRCKTFFFLNCDINEDSYCHRCICVCAMNNTTVAKHGLGDWGLLNLPVEFILILLYAVAFLFIFIDENLQ